MLRRSPRAALLWGAALVVALATTMWVGSALASLHRQDLRYGSVVELVVARHDLAIGTVVRHADLSVVHARGGARPPGALLDPTRAAGRVVAVPVLRGEALTATTPRRRAP